MKDTAYLPRVIDSMLELYLQTFGCVCIEGPKWCGKTMTGLHHANSSVFIADPAGQYQNRRLAEMTPEILLSGGTPRLIDEWQEVPSLWDAVRFHVDMTPGKGQFILTGSATPNRKGILHSGTGRIATLRMRPMSLFESGESTGDVSLKGLFDGDIPQQTVTPPSLRKLASYIVRGGWPGSLPYSEEQAALLPKQYINTLLANDLERMDSSPRDITKMKLLLRSLARNESTAASARVLIRDVRDRDAEDIHPTTVSAYLDLFSRLFLTENQPPFATGVRSSVRVKQAEKRHFCDPSLAASLLGISADGLIGDLETFGFLFEALCERDLRIYAESFGATLFHYQDYKDREIDAVIELDDGRWGAFEIKLGANQIDAAAESLLRIKTEFDSDPKGRPPSLLCVLCGLTNAAYRRPDGVFVIPLTALRN